MIKIPEEWGEVSFKDGIGPEGLISDGDWIESKDQDINGYVRLIQLADIGDGTFRDKSNRFMTLEKANLLNCTFLKTGDILVARMPEPLGRSCVFPLIDQTCVTVVDICLLRTTQNSHFRSNLLPYWINSPQFRGVIALNATGTTRKRITRKKLEAFLVPLPALAEQDEIESRLKLLLGQVDKIKTRLDGIPAILKSFRQSVLSAAVTGKLTEDWRKEMKPSSVIRESILKNRKLKWEEFELKRLKNINKEPINDKWKKKYKLPISIKETECYSIPESWVWSNVSELGFSLKDGPHYSPKYSDSGVPFISGGNIRPEGIDFSKTKYISKELDNELSKRCKPEIGDILYTKGGTTGIAYLNEETKDFNVWVHVAVIKIVDNIHGKYVQHALNSKHCYDQSQSYTHGVGNQDLGLTRMIHITIPIPPIEEQQEIVKCIESLNKLANLIEIKVKEAQSRVDNLTQSILAKAFCGDLTKEWRELNRDLISGDNSAFALLEKIKAEQEKLKPKKKSRKKK